MHLNEFKIKRKLKLKLFGSRKREDSIN